MENRKCPGWCNEHLASDAHAASFGVGTVELRVHRPDGEEVRGALHVAGKIIELDAQQIGDLSLMFGDLASGAAEEMGALTAEGAA